MQLFRAEMPQIEMNHVAARRGDGASGAPFVPERLRNFVARAQFHIFVFRRSGRRFRAKPVILQIAIAILIHQNASFAPTAFRHQNAGAGQTGRVVLHEFHIAQRNAVAQRHAHAVAGDDAAVGIIAVDATGAAGRQHHGARAQRHQRALHHIQRHQSADAAVVYQQIQYKMLVKAAYLRVLQRGLKQRVQHMEAGFISGEPGALNLHAAEAAHVDAAVRLTTPRAAPLFQLNHFFRAVAHKVVHHILLAQPVAASDGVVKVSVETVMLLGNGGGTAFGSYGVAAHGIDF